MFPRQDELKPGEFGNAMRAPLGVHRGAGRRYWFYRADYDLGSQFRYLRTVRRVTEAELKRLINGKASAVPALARSVPLSRRTAFRGTAPEFHILDYVQPKRRMGGNFIARCPSCAQSGHDTAGDNLSISEAEPLKYKCWAGCTREMIRAALGRPAPERKCA